MKRQNLFGKRSNFRGSSNRRQNGSLAPGGRQLRFEPLEERALLSAIPTWIPQGPTPITNGQAENIPSTGPGANPVVGAIHDIAAHPVNPNIAYLGTVNGGVWRSTDFTSANPTYTPLTDQFPGTSIGALEFDPTDATNLTLYAGIGHFSSFGRSGAPLTGLLRTTDGGNTWTQVGAANLTGRNISGVVARGNTIVVAANSFGGGVGGGVYRSTDGATFNLISGTGGLGVGAAFDLVGDPTNLNRIYVSVGGVGIFFSGNQGATWNNVSSGNASLNANITAAVNNNIEMAVSPTTGRIYAGVLTNGRLFYMGFSDNQGGAWTEMDLPVTNDTEGIFSTSPRENPGGQGSIHFSIVVDPTTATTVYIGGDRQPSNWPLGPTTLGANDFSGRLFRGDTTVAPNNPGGKAAADVGSPQWDHLTHTQNLVFAGGGTANNSSPHADSRDMAFRADGVLVEVDDGGIYGRTNPENNTGDWFSLISGAAGGLQVTEIHDVAYDNNSNVLMSGHQDTGTAQQAVAGSLTWTSVPLVPPILGGNFSTADGGDVAVDNLIGGGQSLRYSSTQNLGFNAALTLTDFRRQVYNAAGNLISQAIPTLAGPGITPQFVTPLAVNEVAANRLVIGGSNGVFESTNRGDNVALVSPAPVFAPPLPPVTPGFTRFNTIIDSLDYGAAGNAEFLYAGFSVIDRGPGPSVFQTAGVFGRSAAGLMTQRTAPAGAFILNDIEMDSTNGNTVYTIDNNQAWVSLDGGNNWTDVTGNLSDNNLQSLQYVENPSGPDVILIGGEGGVFRTSVDNLGTWSEFGMGLPNSIVYDMDYDAADDIFVVGTLGRGAWAVEDASAAIFDFQEVEPNNTQATATILGSLPKITLRDLSIEGALDVDFFKYTAQDTGKLIVNMFFDATGDNLDLRVRDANGNVIATGTQSNILPGLDSEGVVIPVVTQEEYWIEVFGTLPNVTVYDLEIENFPAPIPDVVLDPASDTGYRDNDNLTRDNTPRFLIQADLADFEAMGITLDSNGAEGADVEVHITGVDTGTFVNGNASRVGATDLWRFTPAAALPDDVYLVSAAVNVTDGQTPSETGRWLLGHPLRVSIDTQAPTVTTPDMAPYSDSGASNTDNVTNITAPAFFGFITGVEPGGSVQVLLRADGFTAGKTDILAENDSFEITSEPLKDGVHNMDFLVKDLAGNFSTSAAGLDIVIDSIDGSGQPQRPTVDLLDADDTGMSATDNNTRLSTLRFRVTADPGATVDVKDGNTVIDTFVMPAAGEAVRTYNFVALVGTTGFPAEGPHPLSAESTDLAGNRGPQAEELLVTIDQTAPTVDVPDMLASSDSGLFSNDEVTNINAPAFDGFVRLRAPEAGVRVFLFASGKQIGQTDLLVDFQDDTFQYEITSKPLDDGAYGVAATVQDLAGNFAGSLALPIWIDTVAPNTPYLDLVDASDSGRSNQDNVTNDNRPTVTVTADDTVSGDGNPFWHDVQYRIYDRPDLVGNNGEVLLVDSFVTNPGLSTNGFFTETLSTLADGVTAYTLPDAVHNLKLEVEDRAGNISHDFLLEVTIDTVAPPVTITGIDPATSDTGVEGQPATFADNITSDTATGFVGTAEADAIVRMWADGAPVSTGVINGSDVFQGLTVAVPLDGNLAFPNGQWNLAGQYDLNDPTVGFPLDGHREISTTAEDLAGNVSAPEFFDVFLDTRGPQVNGVAIAGAPAYDLFNPKGPATPDEGPTPLVFALDIAFVDQPTRVDGALNFVYPAVNQILATEPGNYRLVGDANGVIPIERIAFSDTTAAGGIGTTTVTLNFFKPLPDDRFTLTLFDRIKDDAGNALDGESNAIEPQDNPQFPSGDGDPGESFVGRFTVDSRPEIGVWSAGSVYTDTNGNFLFDPTNLDFTNRDITYLMGFASDDIFAGNFAAPGGAADGFDKLAAYGHNTASRYRWLVDTDNDGVADINSVEPAAFDGLGTPVAGNFDGNAANGDEVGLFTGSSWLLDTDHDFLVSDEVAIDPGLVGYPIAGDFDGDGADDLGVFLSGVFSFDLAAVGGLGNGIDASFPFNFLDFIGPRERPVAADMNQDGIDDLGLWVPDRSGAIPDAGGEWYFLISDATLQAAGSVAPLNHSFEPVPFGDDLFAQFGDQYAAPVVGNFDPPVAGAVTPTSDTLRLEGTEGDDNFKVVVDGPGQWTTVQYRGIQLSVGPEIVAITFDGLGGKDTVDITGSALNEKAKLWPGRGKLIGEGYLVAVGNVESITVHGGGGGDAAVLYDDPAGKDSFEATPELAKLHGDGFFNQVAAFRYVHGVSSEGNEDSAVLFDDPNTDDILKAWPDQTRLYGETFFSRALGFSNVRAFGTPGNKDVAALFDSAGNDTFTAWPDEASLVGDGFLNRAVSFGAVHAYSIAGGVDVAQLYGSAGRDRLVAKSRFARLSGDGFRNRAVSFDQVHAYGGDGDDLAVLYDAVLEAGLTQQPVPANIAGIVWIHDIETIRERSTTGGGTSTTDAVDAILTAYWQ